MIDLHTGRIVATSALVNWAAGNHARCAWLTDCLTRHAADDWGDLDDEDRATNAAAIRSQDGRVMSVYPVPAELRRPADGAWRSVLWVITDDLEDPDTFTTVLWPSEY